MFETPLSRNIERSKGFAQACSPTLRPLHSVTTTDSTAVASKGGREALGGADGCEEGLRFGATGVSGAESRRGGQGREGTGKSAGARNGLTRGPSTPHELWSVEKALIPIE